MKRLAAWLLAWALLAPGAAAADRLPVVATLSTFADLAKAIGGQQVDVTTLVPPQSDPHRFTEPAPNDLPKIKHATLFIYGGLDLEPWRIPLLEAVGNAAILPGGPGELDLSEDIMLMEIGDNQGEMHLYGNPHYWTDPGNAKPMAKLIMKKLAALDPEHKVDYQRNYEQFVSRLDQKIARWRAAMGPYAGRELVADHRGWTYLMRFLGLRIDEYLELRPGTPPDLARLAALELYLMERKVPIIQASYFPPAAANGLSQKTGVKVAQLCQNVGELPMCSDYVTMVDYNVEQITKLFRK